MRAHLIRTEQTPAFKPFGMERGISSSRLTDIGWGEPTGATRKRLGANGQG